VAAHVKGAATDALVDTYQAERRPHAVDMVRLSHRIGKVVMSTHPVLTTLRDAAITALGVVPAAKGWLAGMKFLKQPHFTEGCVAPAGPGVPKAAAALIGRSLSQPVVTPDPTVHSAAPGSVPLDTVLGPGWALLTFPAGSGSAGIEIQQLGADAEGTVEVSDATGAFTALAGSGITLVVRPDRYVATAAAPGRVDAALESLSRYVPELAARVAVRVP
jgi:3-(3-hydroxy-phenyl)propionate hydroxylase